MLPIPKNDTRSIVQNYQLLCNAKDGKIFKYPVPIKDEGIKISSELKLYLSKVDRTKLIAFEYETGYVGFSGLFNQIKEAKLSTQEIINVVTAADQFGPYSTDDIFELKYDLERHMSDNEDLMEWLHEHPSKPPEGWPDSAPQSPAPV